MTGITGVYEEIDLSVAPMALEDVKERLSVLHDLDSKIIDLLETASSAVASLKDGKQATTEDALVESKAQFESSTKQYFALLESITVKLRKEVRLLHYMSKEKVLPLSLPAKAVWLGREKEKQVWASIESQLEAIDGTSREAKEVPHEPAEEAEKPVKAEEAEEAEEKAVDTEQEDKTEVKTEEADFEMKDE